MMGSRAAFVGLAAALAAGAALPGAALAGRPAAGTVLANQPGASLAGTAIRGDAAVVVWRETVDGFRVPVATVTDDGGLSWSVARSATGGADAAQVDAEVCDGVAALTFVSDQGTPAQPQLAAAVVGVRDVAVEAGWNNFAIVSGRTRDPRVACRGQQLMLAWAVHTDGAWRLKAALWGDARRYLPGGVTPVVRQRFGLGTLDGPGRQRPSIDADADRAFVAWVSGNQLRLARWETAAAAPHDLVRADDLQLAQGSAARPLADPLVALDGDRVVVVWTHCGDLRARVSEDGGATFGPARTLFDGTCPGKPSARLDALAAAGGKVGITYRRIRAAGDQARIVTFDDGLATTSELVLDQAGDRWMGGWVGAPVPVLAAVSDIGDTIKWMPPGSLEP